MQISNTKPAHLLISSVTKSSFVGILLVAIWPLAVTMAIILAFERGAAVEMVHIYQLVALLLPLLFLIIYAWYVYPNWRERLTPIPNGYIVLLVLSWFPGLLIGFSPGYSLIYIVLTCMAFFIAMQYVQLFTKEDLRLGLALFATLGALYLALQTVRHKVYLERIGVEAPGLAGLGANAIAYSAMTCACFGFAWRNALLRYSTLLLGLSVPVAVNSRSSILGVVVTIIAYTLVVNNSKEFLRRLIILILMGGLIGGLIVAFFATPAMEGLRYVTAFDDPHRGVGSGLSGRVEYKWIPVWNEIKDHPILGVGFRCSELVTGFPPDNGYLTYLLETGIIGSLAAFILIWVVLRRSTALLSDPINRILFSASCGYLAHSIFERFIFNVGNPGSLLFIMWIVYVMYHWDVKRKLSSPAQL